MTEYEASCLGKTRFLNRRTAKHRANAIRRTGGPALRAYECKRYCGLWHLGHHPGHATYLRGGPNNPTPVQEYTP
ncbi:hypothetical protein ACIQUD_32190 [Streptomyces globisporus]|uniref:hypothetical protein n=1 Tax=Streptomyces globisporus TaxID=1908 RepID=UPI00380A1346